MGLITAVTSGLSTVISWCGTVVFALLGRNDIGSGERVFQHGALEELTPLFAIGIAISAILLGIKLIRNICWGT